MLSPGEFHKMVPRDIDQNIEFRRWILRKAQNDREIQQALTNACSVDILFWINAFVMQFNPKKKKGNREVAPFVTWDFQERAILSEEKGKEGILWCIENDQDCVVEKSREMGATWIFLLVVTWLNRFRRDHQSLMISKSAEAVDSASRNALFPKIDFVHEHMPDWLRGKITRTKMFIGYDDTRSETTGEASTGRAGVSGRTSEMFIDEFSKIKEDWDVFYKTAATTGCRIFNGTHEGVGTAFFEICANNPYFHKIQFHWSQHPDKNKGLYRYDPVEHKIEVLDKSYQFPPDFNFVQTGHPLGGPYPGLRSPWYDHECGRLNFNERQIAMEQDINPQGSVSQVFNAGIISSLKGYCQPPLWEGDLQSDPEGKMVAMLPREDGALKLWVNLDKDDRPPPGIYSVGADLSQGMGATPSCLAVVNCVTGEKVGELVTATVPPIDMAPIAVALCWLFKTPDGRGAKLGWEAPGPGQTFGKKVMELGYRNVYTSEYADKLTKKETMRIGWWPGVQDNKSILLNELAAGLYSRNYLERSIDALLETLVFQYDSSGKPVHAGEISVNDPSGAKINHGDRVIASGLAWMMAKVHWNPKQKKQKEEAPVGSLAWRRKLHYDRERQEQYA